MYTLKLAGDLHTRDCIGASALFLPAISGSLYTHTRAEVLVICFLILPTVFRCAYEHTHIPGDFCKCTDRAHRPFLLLFSANFISGHPVSSCYQRRPMTTLPHPCFHIRFHRASCPLLTGLGEGGTHRFPLGRPFFYFLSFLLLTPCAWPAAASLASRTTASVYTLRGEVSLGPRRGLCLLPPSVRRLPPSLPLPQVQRATCYGLTGLGGGNSFAFGACAPFLPDIHYLHQLAHIHTHTREGGHFLCKDKGARRPFLILSQPAAPQYRQHPIHLMCMHLG